MTQPNIETFRLRRDQWINKTTDQDRIHPGPETRVRHQGDNHDTLSILGAGLMAIQQECQDWVTWEGPEDKDGMLWWRAQDTTITLADNYGMNTETIDILDEMIAQGATTQDVTRFLQEQPIIL